MISLTFIIIFSILGGSFILLLISLETTFVKWYYKLNPGIKIISKSVDLIIPLLKFKEYIRYKFDTVDIEHKDKNRILLFTGKINTKLPTLLTKEEFKNSKFRMILGKIRYTINIRDINSIQYTILFSFTSLISFFYVILIFIFSAIFCFSSKNVFMQYLSGAMILSAIALIIYLYFTIKKNLKFYFEFFNDMFEEINNL